MGEVSAYTQRATIHRSKKSDVLSAPEKQNTSGVSKSGVDTKIVFVTAKGTTHHTRSVFSRLVSAIPGIAMVACLVMKAEINDCLNPMNLVDYPLGAGQMEAGLLGPVFEYLNYEYAGKAFHLLCQGNTSEYDQQRETFLDGKLRYHTVSACRSGYYLSALMMLGWKIKLMIRDFGK